MARIAQFGVSLLIPHEDNIALPFYHLVWYYFKVGRQFVVMGLVEQDVISLANFTVLC